MACTIARSPGHLLPPRRGVYQGIGLFAPVEYRPPVELADERFPLLLTTGRRLPHYHTGSLTHRVKGLSAVLDQEMVQIDPADASKLGVTQGEQERISSRHGKVVALVEITTDVQPGVVFMDFHFAESPTNILTTSTLDPVPKISELKVCAVRVDRVTVS
ncbi:MAG: molybdopterin oxidoreductase family protein [Chloroflexota bacterium]|jgi:predicted molibdopterin-dependent oxidoreductase YjgC